MYIVHVHVLRLELYPILCVQGIVSSSESSSTSAAGLPSIVTSQDNDGREHIVHANIRV